MLVAAGNERGDKLVADSSSLATVCAGVVAIALHRLRWCFLFWFLSGRCFCRYSATTRRIAGFFVVFIRYMAVGCSG